jgi:hypothetical protein
MALACRVEEPSTASKAEITVQQISDHPMVFANRISELLASS